MADQPDTMNWAEAQKGYHEALERIRGVVRTLRELREEVEAQDDADSGESR